MSYIFTEAYPENLWAVFKAGTQASGIGQAGPTQAIHAGQALLVFCIMKSRRATAYRIVSAPALSSDF